MAFARQCGLGATAGRERQWNWAPPPRPSGDSRVMTTLAGLVFSAPPRSRLEPQGDACTGICITGGALRKGR
jgi:hypothetical protein